MNSSTDPALSSLAEISRRIRAKELSPVEVLKDFLERIEVLDGELHTFNCIARDTALAEAKKAESALLKGDRRGPLHGIPLGIKDMIDVAGLPTTAQATHRRNQAATADADVVFSLRIAGAVILGKQAMSEYAVGGTQVDHVWPPVRNPWDTSRDALSSSSGSCAAVAAGLCAGSIGTETAGSIRAPAAWCGVAGLKPTFGLVSTRGVMPMAPTMDCIGPIGWTAEDCGLLLSGMSGEAHRTMSTSRSGNPRDWRFAVVRQYYEGDPNLDPAVHLATENAIEALRDLGAEERNIRLSDFDELCKIAKTISWPEEYAHYRDELKAHPDRLTAVSRSRLQDGNAFSAADYIDAKRRRKQVNADLEDAMRNVDFLVLPTLKTPAQVLGFEFTELGKKNIDLTRPFNLSTGPALAMCHGFSPEGLPLSLQLIGKPFDDALVLQAGDLLEKTLGLRSRRPEIARA